MAERDGQTPPEAVRTPVRMYRLGEEPVDDLRDDLTAEELWDLVRELSDRMWELTGRPFPDYSREEMPVRVVELR